VAHRLRQGLTRWRGSSTTPFQPALSAKAPWTSTTVGVELPLVSLMLISSLLVCVERQVRIEVSAHDWNCPRHITPRYSVEELSSVLAPLRQRVADLEAENRRLRAEQRLGAG
jgi:hypothetical protein